MGTLYGFFCPECGYSVEVSGGDDYGFFAAVTTIQCDKCHIIKDVVTSKTPEDKESYKPVSKLKCPKCRGPVKSWDGEHCPKCNHIMQKDEKCGLPWD